MESTLLTIFDELDSADAAAVSTGLNRLDQLLADICLPSQLDGNNTTRTVQSSVRSTATAGGSKATRKHTTKNISILLNDPAYVEILALQDSFQYNVASRVMACLARLANPTPEGKEEQLIFALDLLQGLFLLHHPSRSILAIESNMRVLVGLLAPALDSNLHIAVINTLVSGMVREVASIRRFELVGGLAVICELFKLRDTTKDVKLRILEFLFFYLVPETQQRAPAAAVATKGQDLLVRRTTEDKATFLRKYLSNVDGLVNELHTSRPFGDMKHEW